MGGRAHKHEPLRLKGYRSTWMCGYEKVQHKRSKPPVPMFELHFSVLTSMLTQCSSMLTLTYTTPSQRQWLPGMRGKQEPPRRARSRAPTCSHPLGRAAPTTCRRKSSLPPSTCRSARRRDLGKAKDLTFQGPSSHSRESSTQGLICTTRPNHGKLANAVSGFTFASIRMYDNRLTK